MEITGSVVAERDRGLLGGDYNTYHAQTSRRIHKLRSRLGTATPRGRKYTPKAPVTADNVAQNAESVRCIILYQTSPLTGVQMDPASAGQRRACMGECDGHEVGAVYGKYSETSGRVYQTPGHLAAEKSHHVRGKPRDGSARS